MRRSIGERCKSSANSRKTTSRRPESVLRMIVRCASAGTGNASVPMRQETIMSLKTPKMRHFAKASRRCVSASVKLKRMCGTRSANSGNDTMKSKKRPRMK